MSDHIEFVSDWEGELINFRFGKSPSNSENNNHFISSIEK